MDFEITIIGGQYARDPRLSKKDNDLTILISYPASVLDLIRGMV